MKIKVDTNKKGDFIITTLTVIDTEEMISNKLFSTPLDYPSHKYYEYVQDDINNINYIENIVLTEQKAKDWVNIEIEALKNKLGI